MALPIGEIVCGDCLDVLQTFPADSVDCCVTSPPYWGLRDYGTATWDGGNADCDHIIGTDRNDSGQRCGALTGGPMPGGDKYARTICPKCGATRVDQQLGLEPTPEAYVSRMVAVFAEVRRVLKDEGTLWLNLGDSYAGSSGSGGKTEKQSSNTGSYHDMGARFGDNTKPKDMIGIPWRVAFALQADGWYLRSDIIWAKPNPMPESVTDRPTKSHEHIFLLSKSARYHYDAAAIAEEGTGRNWRAAGGNLVGAGLHKCNDGYRDNGNGSPGEAYGRNARDVWTIATQPYSGAHFATFPPELPRRCILAGCPPGGIVLDPFFGSGTVGEVAEQLGRQWVGIELNAEYIALARKRTAQRGLFTEVAS